MRMTEGRREMGFFVGSFFIVTSVILHSVTVNVILEMDDADVFFKTKHNEVMFSNPFSILRVSDDCHMVTMGGGCTIPKKVSPHL